MACQIYNSFLFWNLALFKINKDVNFIYYSNIIFKKEKKEAVLIFLDATGKCPILDSYVIIHILVAFHFVNFQSNIRS